MTRSIGGYFELELNREATSIYPNLIYLNTGRNALEYILKVRGYKKLYIPYYTCDVIFEPVKKLNIDFEFYDINDELEPYFDFSKIEPDSGFIYTNYFGIKSDYIKKLSSKINNLIIDNAQALFSAPLPNIDTFFSPRKFVGISDGALLAINQILKENLDTDLSFDRFNHLLKRIDLSAEMAYADFFRNESLLHNQSIKKMSNLTRVQLNSINWQNVRNIRRENFIYLDQNLKNKNNLKILINSDDVPLIYPFRHKNAEYLRKELASKKIYCATYWPNVKMWCQCGENALYLAKEILPLPIDQRYGLEEMKIILSVLNTLLK